MLPNTVVEWGGGKKKKANKTSGVTTTFGNAHPCQRLHTCLVVSAFHLWSHGSFCGTGNFSWTCTEYKYLLWKTGAISRKNEPCSHICLFFALILHPLMKAPYDRGAKLPHYMIPVYDIKVLPILVFQSMAGITLQQFGICCRNGVAAASTGKRAEPL